MHLAPIQPEFFIALIRDPKAFGGNWYAPEQPISDTANDALDMAMRNHEDGYDYRILSVSMEDGTSRDVTEDAWRECSWSDDLPLALADDNIEAATSEGDKTQLRADYENKARREAGE